MIDPRIYRAAFLPAIAALVVVAFSLQPRPKALTAELAPDAFDSARAATLARELVELAPDRTPGGQGAAAARDFVVERLAAVGTGELMRQRFEAELGGRRVAMENLVLVLPGASDRRVVAMARRDSAEPPGAVSSAAATGALLEMAAAAGAARHRKTLIFVSTEGAAAGGAGARRFAERFPRREKVEAAIVLDQPAVRGARTPFLIPWSAGPGSTSIQLVQSAKTAIRQEVGRDPGVEGWPGYLLRLAFPFGLQDQAVLIDRGIDAVTLSARGELPLRPAGDAAGQVSAARLGQLGRAALALMLALDEHRAPLVHGPRAQVVAGGNLIPGWALALLGLGMLVPAGAAAIDGFARARRRRQRVGRWLGGLGLCAAPFLAALALAHLLSLSGLIPDPDFPYDPRRYPLDGRAAAALAALAALFAGAWLAVRPLALPASGALAGHGAAAALGLGLWAVAFAVWLLNPYAALLLVPAVHLWMLAVQPRVDPPRWRPLAMVAAGLLGPALAVGYVADRLDAGWGVAWQLLLMTTGGQVGLPLSLAGCLLGGCLAATLVLARGGRNP